MFKPGDRVEYIMGAERFVPTTVVYVGDRRHRGERTGRPYYVIRPDGLRQRVVAGYSLRAAVQPPAIAP